MKNKIITHTIYILIVSVISLFFTSKTREKTDEINNLTEKIEELKNQPVETIKIKDTEVVYKYRDGEKQIIERVPDGYVMFDMAKYDRKTKELAGLQKEYKMLESKLSMVEMLNEDEVEKYKSRLKEVRDSISNFSPLIDRGRPVEKLKVDVKEYISIKNHGFCFKPSIGVGYSDGISPYIGAKVAFWNNYGLNIGATKNSVGVGFSRRLNFIPLVNNTEMIVLYGYPYKSNNNRLFAGLSIKI
mgnify:CR=1 FL=1